MTNLETRLIVTIVLFVAVANAVTVNDTEEAVTTLAEVKENDAAVTDVGTSRTALLGLYGLHALAVLYVIKVKVIIVAFILALSIYYYAKVYLKDCKFSEFRDTNPYDSYPSNGLSGYSNSLPAGIGYPGTDRFNSFSIASHDHDHHHEHSGHSHESIPSFVESEGKPSSPPLSTDKSEMTHRIYNQMRQFPYASLFNNIDWSDMGFELLGLDTDECRRRFTCELDFRVKQIPFSSYVFDADGPAFLNKYRESEDNVNMATTFTDCALFYAKCKY